MIKELDFSRNNLLLNCLCLLIFLIFCFDNEFVIGEQFRELDSILNRIRADKPKFSVNLKVDSSAEDTIIENSLLESVLTTLISKDDVSSAHAFLEANSSHESCQRLLKMWNW